MRFDLVFGSFGLTAMVIVSLRKRPHLNLAEDKQTEKEEKLFDNLDKTCFSTF